MTTWTTDELHAIGNAEELLVTPYERESIRSGAPEPRAEPRGRRPVPIWVVRVGDDLYVRSWRGLDGRWYRDAQQNHAGHIRAGGVDKDVTFVAVEGNVNDAIDDAYRGKYRHSAYVPPMVTPEARATTLKLVPRSQRSASSTH